jgi:NAD(P)H-dependent FMN reductase
MSRKVVAVVGSYRKGGTTDTVVEAVLAGAREKGAETSTIYLIDRPIEFCTNCRECMQTPGPERGKCVQKDGLEPMLQEIEAADAIVLGSPINHGNVTAIFRRFMERIVGYGYWPWGQKTPSGRKKVPTRKAVLVATSAMPGFLVPLATGTGYALRTTARILGAKPVGALWIGLTPATPNYVLSPKNRKRARALGWKLA